MNSSSDALDVVCAWPVSGQYGPGSRVLYYVLVAACVFARKEKWLRGACLAAALLFPAVAALHAIVLAAVNVGGAVDMDIYGAFQLCSIGILAAPVTVKLSSTYFNDPGRNIIFIWTGLILAGLLSLTVEFYRSDTSRCTQESSGMPITGRDFEYGVTTCGLTCSVQQGPFSPIRGGSANNIYVIPSPDKFTFGTGTLLAAACCIPAILSMITMWNKILEINWKNRFGEKDQDKKIDEPIEGTNEATVRKMRMINERIGRFLSVVEVPIFGAAVLAILIVGERNFFSHQVRYQTEPIASIGQWAPIVGTGLAALGSLYLLLAKDMEKEKDSDEEPHVIHSYHCPPDHHHDGQPLHSHYESDIVALSGGRSTQHIEGDPSRNSAQKPPPEMREVSRDRVTAASRAATFPVTAESGTGISREMTSTTIATSRTTDVGGRRKIANNLLKLSNYFSTAAPNRYNDDEFRHGKAQDFPEIPGEDYRNSALPQIREMYNQPRDINGNVTPALRAQRSRADSFRSDISGLQIDRSSISSRPDSLESREAIDSSHVTSSPAPPRRPHASTLPAARDSSNTHDPASATPTGLRPEMRRSTLEVPAPVHFNLSRKIETSSSNTPIAVSPGGEGSPAIVVSPEPITASPTDIQASNPPTPLSPTTPLPPPVTAPGPRS